MTTFAEEFARSKGRPIEYQGRKLELSHWVSVSGGDRVAVKLLRFTPKPVQGVGLTADRCQLQVASHTSKNIALWTDTAPRDVEITIVKAKPGARLGLMNQWRDERHGTTLMGLNNAAMEVQPQPDGSMLLRCSDGWSGPDFNDLVLQVKIEPGTQAPCADGDTER